jgi:hypothetical protein
MLAIVSSVLLRFMPSDYPFGICWPLYRLSYFNKCLLITPLVSFGQCIVCPTLVEGLNQSRTDDTLVKRYQRGNRKASIKVGQTIQWPTFTNVVIRKRLPLWYRLPIVSSVLLQCMPSDYPFGIFWPLYRMSYFDVCLLITPLVSLGQCIVCPTLICAF